MFLFLVGAAFAAPLSPDDAVAAALASNPALARADAELIAAKGAARQSAFLRENPEIEGGYDAVGGRVDASISQPLSLTGEGLADHRSQRARVAAAEAGVGRARLEVAADTRLAYLQAVVAHQDAVLVEQAFALATRQLAATEARVRAGEVGDLDLRLARLDQARSAGALLAARSAEAEALAKLAALVHQPLGGADLPPDPLLASPEPRPSSAEERSDVRAARLAIEAADAAVARERAAALPPVTVGGFYEAEGGRVVAGPSLGMTLPLWQQNQASVAEARGAAGVARAELEATSARADAERRTAADAHVSALTTMAAVPATPDDATAAFASIEAGARSGELDLVTTILLRDEVVAGQQGLIEARGQLATLRITLLLATEDDALLGGASR